MIVHWPHPFVDVKVCFAHLGFRCGHCQQLAPAYSQAAATLKEDGVTLAKVDATQEEQLSDRFSVHGYPTLKIFRDGRTFDYQGPRTAAGLPLTSLSLSTLIVCSGIVEYMRGVASPNWTPPKDPVLVLTGQNFSSVAMETGLVLVEFYAPWCGHCKRLAPEYQRAAGRLREIRAPCSLAKIDATVETDLATLYGVKGYPTLLLFRHGDHKEYSGGRDANGEWIKFVLRQGWTSHCETCLWGMQFTYLLVT